MGKWEGGRSGKDRKYCKGKKELLRTRDDMFQQLETYRTKRSDKR